MIRRYLVTALTLLNAGCASITTGSGQTVSVVTQHESRPLNGAACELINDKGRWQVVTPNSANIQRSAQELIVRCELPGYEAGLSVLRSSAGMVWGNVIAGGLVGFAVDASSGAGFDYPPRVTIDLVPRPGTSGFPTPPASIADKVSQTTSEAR